MRRAIWLVVAVLYVVPATKPLLAEDLEFFETKIRPVLAQQCYGCHSAEAKTRMGGLSLDTRDGIREGGMRGHAVVPGDLESSLILGALRYEGSLKMPPTGKLSDGVVSDFERWIAMGAPDPREAEVVQSERKIDLSEGRKYWAFQAPSRQAAPKVTRREWADGAIDRLVLAGLEDKGLRPAPDATRSALLRRVSIDLTGLPPTAAEVEAFLEDRDSGAYERVVDRLLKSENFGERWGRHWLDVARYADSIGRTRNLPFPLAWRYRDYVIDAFNEGLPYDEFIRQQVAGDLLPYDTTEERVRNQVATGFLAIGANDLNEPDAKQFEADIADEMINVSTRSFLALSVGCARCHDHKFDPIPTEDYYSLAAIFRSSELRTGLRRRPRFNARYFRVAMTVELDGLQAYPGVDGAGVEAERARLEKEMNAAEEARDRTQSRAVSKQLSALPMPQNIAMGVVEAGNPVKMRVNVGGDPHTLGDPVEAGFVQVVYPSDAEAPRIPKNASGRLQLAEWLASKDNPLTARVMANRVWHHLFGKGLVSTVDNFGASGRQPTNQALLDHLAVRFMDEDWSVKSLIREIVTSRTYRMSTRFDPHNFEIDPDNDHVWRANLRRLEAESVRDSVLVVSGELSAGPPKLAPMLAFDRNQLINPNNRNLRPWDLENTYRSLYVPVIRNQARPMFEAFDFPEPSETKGVRDITTGPSQALFLMNNDFVREQAGIAAERLMAAHSDDRARVRRAFRQTLSRDPTDSEADRALLRVRETIAGLGEEGPAEGGIEAAREVVGEVLAHVLDREPSDDEMSAAMDYMEARRPEAAHSADGASAFLTGDNRRLSNAEGFELVQQVLERELEPKEMSRAKQGLRHLMAQAEDTETAKLTPARFEHEGWTRFYHALFKSAEFRYRN